MEHGIPIYSLQITTNVTPHAFPNCNQAQQNYKSHHDGTFRDSESDIFLKMYSSI